MVLGSEGPTQGVGPLLSCPLIVLVGMMGAGKTTVGKELARRWKYRFVDCDHEIEARTGVKIPTIFEIEGEEGFRRRESQTLDELTVETGLVLATGGGAVLRPANRALLHERGSWFILMCLPRSCGREPGMTAIGRCCNVTILGAA